MDRGHCDRDSRKLKWRTQALREKRRWQRSDFLLATEGRRRLPRVRRGADGGRHRTEHGAEGWRGGGGRRRADALSRKLVNYIFINYVRTRPPRKFRLHRRNFSVMQNTRRNFSLMEY